MTRLVYGVRPVMELLHHPERVRKVLLEAGRDNGSLREIRSRLDSLEKSVETEEVPRLVLDRLADGGLHQGVLIRADDYPYVELRDLLRRPAPAPGLRRIILACDEITDPQNLGSMLRSLEALGGAGAIVMQRRGVDVTAAVLKASAGAAEHVPVARVVNLSRALEEADREGFVVCGLDMDGDTPVRTPPDCDSVVLVVGSEGTGLRPSVRAHCQRIVSIPLRGRVASLNAGVSVAIALSHWLDPEGCKA